MFVLSSHPSCIRLQGNCPHSRKYSEQNNAPVPTDSQRLLCVAFASRNACATEQPAPIYHRTHLQCYEAQYNEKILQKRASVYRKSGKVRGTSRFPDNLLYYVILKACRAAPCPAGAVCIVRPCSLSVKGRDSGRERECLMPVSAGPAVSGLRNLPSVPGIFLFPA